MSERTRDFLKPEFRDGERPSGADFADLIDSFVNKQTDGVSFDSRREPGARPWRAAGDSAGTVAGGLRFNSNQLQVFTGGAWVNVSGGGGGGAFQPRRLAAATAVVPRRKRRHRHVRRRAPTFRLEVPLGANTGPAEQVRFGNAGVRQRQPAPLPEFAVFSHQQSRHRTATSRCGRRPTAPCTSTPRPGRPSAFVRAARRCGSAYPQPAT